MQSLKVKDVAKKGDVIGDLNKVLGPATSLTNATSNQFTFCRERNVDILRHIRNCVIIILRGTEFGLSTNNTYILADNPRLTFLRVMKLVYPFGVDPQITLGKNVQIGEDTIIGSSGFGFERNEKNELEEFMHIGGVKIGDNVRVGCNCIINRGIMDDTEIGEGTKMGNLVCIGHNVKIGKHCSIAGFNSFSGSTVLGDYSTVTTMVSTRNGVAIGKNVFIGLGSVITKDVPDNMTVMGAPAREINEFKKYLKFVKSHI